MYVPECIYTPHACRHAQRAAEGVRSLGAGVTGGCDPPDMGAGV